ncbi:uncharacterized protein LOC127832444 [Dreissena polymorpha]|uniref:uncharacterized protein LOC127832444 n=1 Tax=Dreissena polymorpha TaxID=45954 RepID=UPI0022648068|nr:uncharacterized protein LOC127832444 [Dreissena polymorpha]
MAEVANCIHCGKTVGQRQRAVSCDACERWQHIGCDSGISLAEYKAATRGEREIHFLCAECCRSIPTIHSVPEDERVSHVDPDLTQLVEPDSADATFLNGDVYSPMAAPVAESTVIHHVSILYNSPFRELV